eukprot:446129-Amphidinium_carterae.1
MLWIVRASLQCWYAALAARRLGGTKFPCLWHEHDRKRQLRLWHTVVRGLHYRLEVPCGEWKLKIICLEGLGHFGIMA